MCKVIRFQVAFIDCTHTLLLKEKKYLSPHNPCINPTPHPEIIGLSWWPIEGKYPAECGGGGENAPESRPPGRSSALSQAVLPGPSETNSGPKANGFEPSNYEYGSRDPDFDSGPKANELRPSNYGYGLRDPDLRICCVVGNETESEAINAAALRSSRVRFASGQ